MTQLTLCHSWIRITLSLGLALVSLGGSGCYQRAQPEDYRSEFVRWQQARVSRTAARHPSPSGDAQVLTLDEAWRLAETQHRQAAIDAADNAALKARVGVAGQVRNPTLRLSNIHIDELAEGDPDIELALRFPLPVPGQAAALQDAARAQLQGQAAQQMERRFQRQQALERLFVDAWAARRRLEGARIYAGVIARRAAAVEAQLATGTATQVQLSRRRLDVAVARRNVDELEEQLESIRGQVGRQTGLSPTAGWRLASPSWLTSTADDSDMSDDAALQGAVAQALKHRAQGQTRRWEVTEAKAKVFVARSEGWPWFDFVQFGYRFQSPMQSDTFAFALSFRLPLFHQNRAAVDEARARLAAASLRKDAWLNSIARDVEASIAAVKRAQRAVRRIEAGVVAAAADHRLAVEKAVGARTSAPEVLEQAKAAELKAAAMLLEGRIQVVYARLRLRVAMGRPIIDSGAPATRSSTATGP